MPCYSRALAALLHDPATPRPLLLQTYLGRVRCNKQLREHAAVVHDCDIVVRSAQSATCAERVVAIRERALAHEALEKPHKALEDWRLLRSVQSAEPDAAHLRAEARLEGFIRSEREARRADAVDAEWVHGQMMWRVAIKAVPVAVVLGEWAELTLQLMNEHGLFTPAALDNRPAPLRLAALPYDPNTVFADEPSAYRLEVEGAPALGGNGKAAVRFRLVEGGGGAAAGAVTLRIEGADDGGLMAVLSSPIRVARAWHEQPFERMDAPIASETYRTFLFRGRLVRVKEDYPQGSLGGRVWDAAYALARYLEGPPGDALRGKRVVELGAGTGFLACCLALLGASVVATDLPDMLPIIRANLSFNGLLAPPAAPAPPPGLAAVVPLDWSGGCGALAPPYDFVLGSDLVYEPKLFAPLAATMAALSDGGTVLYLAYRHRHDEQHCQMYFLEQRFAVRTQTFADVDLVTPVPTKDVLLCTLRLKDAPDRPRVEELTEP